MITEEKVQTILRETVGLPRITMGLRTARFPHPKMEIWQSTLAVAKRLSKLLLVVS